MLDGSMIASGRDRRKDSRACGRLQSRSCPWQNMSECLGNGCLQLCYTSRSRWCWDHRACNRVRVDTSSQGRLSLGARPSTFKSPSIWVWFSSCNLKVTTNSKTNHTFGVLCAREIKGNRGSTSTIANGARRNHGINSKIKPNQTLRRRNLLPRIFRTALENHSATLQTHKPSPFFSLREMSSDQT